MWRCGAGLPGFPASDVVSESVPPCSLRLWTWHTHTQQTMSGVLVCASGFKQLECDVGLAKIIRSRDGHEMTRRGRRGAWGNGYVGIEGMCGASARQPMGCVVQRRKVGSYHASAAQPLISGWGLWNCCSGVLYKRTCIVSRLAWGRGRRQTVQRRMGGWRLEAVSFTSVTAATLTFEVAVVSLQCRGVLCWRAQCSAVSRWRGFSVSCQLDRWDR